MRGVIVLTLTLLAGCVGPDSVGPEGVRLEVSNRSSEDVVLHVQVAGVGPSAAVGVVEAFDLWVAAGGQGGPREMQPRLGSFRFTVADGVSSCTAELEDPAGWRWTIEATPLSAAMWQADHGAPATCGPLAAG